MWVFACHRLGVGRALIFEKQNQLRVNGFFPNPCNLCIQYDNKNVLSLEYCPNLLFYANVPACVLLKNLEIKDAKIYEIESNNSNIPMICKGLKEFNGGISYFSPEMYNTLCRLDFETSDNSTTLK